MSDEKFTIIFNWNQVSFFNLIVGSIYKINILSKIYGSTIIGNSGPVRVRHWSSQSILQSITEKLNKPCCEM